MLSTLNKTCPVCGEKFHCCSSCDINYEWEYTYCSNECYWKSEKTQAKFKRFKDFYNSLLPDQKLEFQKIIWMSRVPTLEAFLDKLRDGEN